MDKLLAEIGAEKVVELGEIEVHVFSQLGAGGFGAVAKGVFRGETVAVKQFDPQVTSCLFNFAELEWR